MKKLKFYFNIFLKYHLNRITEKAVATQIRETKYKTSTEIKIVFHKA